MKHWLLLLGVAVLLAATVPVVVGGSDTFVELARIPVLWLIGMLGIIFVCWNLNAVRLRMMLHDRAEGLSHRQALATIIATEFTFNATPGGSGAPFTLAALLRRHGVSPSAATAVFAVDQLTDMVVFLCLLPTLVFYGLTRYFEMSGLWQIALPFGLLAGALVGLLWVARHYRDLIRITGRLLGRLNVSRERRLKWARSLLNFRQGVEETLAVPPSHLVILFVLCTIHWLMRYSILFLAVLSMGHHIDWVYGFFVQMVAMGAGHVAFLPGGAGAAEVAGAALLTPYLGASTTAAAILVWRFMTFYFYLICGSLVMLAIAGKQFGYMMLPRSR